MDRGLRLSIVETVKVRPAEYADIASLVELRAEMFDAMGVPDNDTSWQAHAHHWFAERINDPSYHFVVVEEAGQVLACAAGAVRDAAPSPGVPGGRDVLISNVCTRPAARGRGLGTAAFEAVMAWAHASGVGRAELLATSYGESMYLRAGFVQSEHPVMRADLRRADASQ